MAELEIGDFITDIHETGTGPTVILCHGSASDRRTWTTQVDALAAQGFRAVNYSRRYHWPNAPARRDASYPMAEHVEDLAALIDTVAPDTVHLVGHSYGGFLALLVAHRHPDLVRSLVLIEPPVVPLLLSEPPTSAEVARLLRHRPRLGATLLKFAATGLVPARKAALNNEMDKAIRAFGKAVLGKRAFGQLSDERWKQIQANNIRAEYLSQTIDSLSEADVRSIHLPTMLVSGSHSPTLWPLLVDYLDEVLPTSRRVQVSNASHLVHEDNPASFNQHLVDFLLSVPSPD